MQPQLFKYLLLTVLLYTLSLNGWSSDNEQKRSGCYVSFNKRYSNEVWASFNTKDPREFYAYMESLPEQPINLGMKQEFLSYMTKIVPYLNMDVFGYVANNYYDWNMPDKFKKENISQRINSPVSYLRSLIKIGHALRKVVFEHYAVDLAELTQLPGYIEKEKSTYLPFIRSFPRVRHPFDHKEIMSLAGELIHIISSLYLRKSGFTDPVVFVGFIEKAVANKHVRESLYVDDPVFSGNLSHGKFSHILMAAMLIEHYPDLTNTWFGDVADEGYWNRLVDNNTLSYDSQDAQLLIGCETEDRESIVFERAWRAESWPSGHNPVVINQLLSNNYYSSMLAGASDNPVAESFFITAINSGASDSEEHITLEEGGKSLKALENFINIEFEGDIKTIYNIREWIPKSSFQENLQACNEHGISVQQLNEMRKGKNTAGSGSLLEGCLGANAYYKLFYGDKNFNEFYQEFLEETIWLQPLLVTFYMSASRPLNLLRGSWLKKNAIKNFSKDPFSHIYQLPSLSYPDQCSPIGERFDETGLCVLRDNEK